MIVNRKPKNRTSPLVYGGDIVSKADSLLKKVGFKGLPELHMRTTSGKKYSYCGQTNRGQC